MASGPMLCKAAAAMSLVASPGAAIRRQSETGILHADRPEQMLGEVIAERLAAGLFHRLADPVDIDAVIPFLARLENQRQPQCRVLAGADRGDALFLPVAAHLRIPGVVDEAGGVGEQVTQGDRPARWAQLRFARGVEALKHLRRCELGQHPGDRLVERELARLDELHRGGRGDRLGHRGDPKQRVLRKRPFHLQVLKTNRLVVDDAFAH